MVILNILEVWEDLRWKTRILVEYVIVVIGRERCNLKITIYNAIKQVAEFKYLGGGIHRSENWMQKLTSNKASQVIR